MTASRNYSSTAGKMTLVGTITGAATAVVVDTVTGLPAVPYTLLLDPGLSVEEVIEVTAIGGTTLTVTRGVDGTSAQGHDSGAEIRHAYSARDFQDSRNHEGNVAAHGATGAVVGTTNTQALTNKTIDYTLNTITNLPAAGGIVGGGVVARITADSATVTAGTPTRDIVSAPSITGDGTKRFKITASVGVFTASGATAGQQCDIRIMDGATQLAGNLVVWASAICGGACVVTTNVPTTGSHTYKLVLARGGIDCKITATATYPCEIIVEQIA